MIKKINLVLFLLLVIIGSNLFLNSEAYAAGCTGHCVNSSTNAQMAAADPHAVTTITGYYGGVYKSQTVCINSLPSTPTSNAVAGGGGGMSCATAPQFDPGGGDVGEPGGYNFLDNFVAYAQDDGLAIPDVGGDSGGFTTVQPVPYDCTPVTVEDDNPPYIPPPQNTPTPFPTPTSQPTSTPTPPPACGSACSGNYSCHSAKDGCTACINNQCSQPSPTPTAAPSPTPTPIPACGTACVRDSDCAGALTCTSCTAGVCSPPATPTPIPQCGT
ncbi:MAG TPA: hypothetical protein VG965_03740, partial [Patescibacteria group bacterium]|nr:hypothetical protein [Patescibacteria group bacterium]